MEAHETHETIHETAHHGQDSHNHHGHSGRNKRIAALISILAALLALVEAGGKSAQNTSLSANIEASNLWAFFQAKTMRMTSVRLAGETVELMLPPNLPADRMDGISKRLTDWKAAASRYDSEPETGEGRKELANRAKAAEAKRDHALSAYHMYEYGAAALQIAIVLASASVVTGIFPLTFVAGGLGVLGIGFGMLGWLAPTLIHL